MFEEQFNAIMTAIMEGFGEAPTLPMPGAPGLPELPTPDAPEIPGGTGGTPFSATSAALMNSGAEVAAFGQSLSDLPGGDTSAGIQSSIQAYQTAFTNAPTYFQGDMQDPPDVAGELTTGGTAVAMGLDSIAASAADEIGTDADGDSGVTFAAQTLVTGGDMAGGVATGALGAGAAVFDAGAMRFAAELAGAAPDAGDGPGPGQQFADAFGEGAATVAGGISDGSNQLTGMVPGQISEGLNGGAQAFAMAFGEGAQGLAAAIGGTGGGEGPALPALPGASDLPPFPGASDLPPLPGASDVPEFSPELITGPISSAITTITAGAQGFENPLPFPA